jgi:hypothetical protein
MVGLWKKNGIEIPSLDLAVTKLLRFGEDALDFNGNADINGYDATKTTIKNNLSLQTDHKGSWWAYRRRMA